MTPMTTGSAVFNLIAGMITGILLFAGTGKEETACPPVSQAVSVQHIYNGTSPSEDNLSRLRDTAFYKSGQVLTKMYQHENKNQGKSQRKK